MFTDLNLLYFAIVTLMIVCYVVSLFIDQLRTFFIKWKNK